MGEENEKADEKSLPKFSEMVERMERANAEAKEILARNEELAARKLLGGSTDAGAQPEPVKEETPQEYAHRIERGILKDSEKR